MTNEIIKFENSLLDLQFIDHIEDMSDYLIKRARVYFKNNKFELSIVYGFGTYGSNNGLLEIAIFDKDGNMTDFFYEDEYKNNPVLGYLTKEEVIEYIKKIGSYKED